MEDLYLGIDLGGTEIKSVVLGGGHRVVWTRQIETRATEGRDAVLERIVDLAAAASRGLQNTRLGGIGVAVPGVLDMESGRLELMTNLTPEWNGFLARDALEARSELPVSLINDVRAATLAELTLGAGQGYTDFICIAIGTGIGGGIVLDGKLYLGSRGAAGEIGHGTVVVDGPLCNCGNRGCMEAVASATAIARDGQAAIAAGDTELAAMVGTSTPTAQELAEAALQGSATAQRIYAHAGQMIGLALGSLICALNPQAGVIGGGVAKAGDLLLAPVREEIARRTVVFSPERGAVEVLQSPLGGQAGAIGAAVWAMQARQADAQENRSRVDVR
ncbi:MAG TPA: ROK family protein [Chloroflexota bacterium]